jgi:hypothetical protein
MPAYYDKDLRKMSQYEVREHRALAREQITHVDLAEYAVGSEHYERLCEQMARIHASYWLGMVGAVNV